MKKLLGIFVAAMLVIGFAGQGMAAFADLQLIRTIYDAGSGSTEIGSDLGANAFTTAGAYTNNMYVGDLVNRTAAGGSSLRVAYSAFNDADVATADYWVMSNVNTGLSMNGRKGSVLQGYSSATQGYYAGFGGTTVTGSKGEGSSYYQQFERNSMLTAGSFGNSLPAGSLNASVSLDDLAGPNHYVDSYLYFFNYNNTNSTNPGTLVATIRTYMTAGADGDFATLSDNKIGTVINPNAVPIPPSVLLLGAGLLGLIGIRRRKA